MDAAEQVAAELVRQLGNQLARGAGDRVELSFHHWPELEAALAVPGFNGPIDRAMWQEITRWPRRRVVLVVRGQVVRQYFFRLLCVLATGDDVVRILRVNSAREIELLPWRPANDLDDDQPDTGRLDAMTIPHGAVARAGDRELGVTEATRRELLAAGAREVRRVP